MAAILAADMAGFSRLMEADEQGTVARQKAYFEEILNPSVQQAKGRIVKTTGDGFLAEFASVVDAVQCAVVMQTAMSQHEIPGQDQPLIQYRMAVNLGDLIIDGDEIYGDGVNIAARLEAFADPGGIVVSGTAFDHLKSNVDVGYEDLGEKILKNISVPVRLYRVVEPSGGPGGVQGGRRKSWGRFPAVILAVLFLAVGSWTWLQFGPASNHSAVTELQALPGIAVLPFENLSVDEEQSYFATGLTEELTARLAYFSNLRVIARNSASQFMDGQHDMRDISRALNAQYLIEGSVRRDSDRIRVTARLIDGEAGDQLWTSTYDEQLSAKAIFDIQDEIAAAVASNVGGLGGAVRKTATLPLVERPDDIEAYDCVLLHYKF
jgi:TolB-like protein/class 3 adenylate cyclase